VGVPSCSQATTLFVVPRSMPMTGSRSAMNPRL
jgi:hypothetical protein